MEKVRSKVRDLRDHSHVRRVSSTLGIHDEARSFGVGHNRSSLCSLGSRVNTEDAVGLNVSGIK